MQGNFFLFSRVSNLVLEPIKPSTKWLPGSCSERKAPEFKHTFRYTSTSLYIFKAFNYLRRGAAVHFSLILSERKKRKRSVIISDLKRYSEFCTCSVYLGKSSLALLVLEESKIRLSTLFHLCRGHLCLELYHHSSYMTSSLMYGKFKENIR
jgi:hypothetical protein